MVAVGYFVFGDIPGPSTMIAATIVILPAFTSSAAKAFAAKIKETRVMVTDQSPESLGA